MDYVPFYMTRPGQKFLDKTVPELIRAIERLSDRIPNQRDSVVQELVDYAADLVEAADDVLDVEIVPGSTRTKESFAVLRTNAEAVRRMLVKIRRSEPPCRS